MNNKSTIRYELRKSEAPLYLKEGWVRITETLSEAGILAINITPVEKPEGEKADGKVE
jgi:hypothetical protein